MTYILLLAFCIICPTVSYLRFRSLLHPHFVFTVSWVYLLPLGMVVSPSVPDYLQSVQGMGVAELGGYHLLINSFLGVLFLVTMFATPSNKSIPMSLVKKSILLPEYKANLFFLGGFIILGAEVGKELYSCNWSFHSWLTYSLGPRFGRPWSGGYEGGSDFLLTFIGNIFNLTAILLPFAVFQTKGIRRVAASAGLVLTLWILACNGSRTPVAFTLLMVALLWYFMVANSTVRITGLLVLLVMFVALLSLMLAFRQNGFISEDRENPQLSEVKYEQDDNYYQLISVLKVAEQGGTHNWDATTFLEACVVNPIPRYFWPGKPFLTPEYFGNWKLSYVTVSYIGECIAMFGKWLGLAAALLVGLVYYRVLLWASRLVAKESGLIVYLGFCFYIYTTQRSMQNIGMNGVFIMSILAFYYGIGQLTAPATRPKRKRYSTSKTPEA